MIALLEAPALVPTTAHAFPTDGPVPTVVSPCALVCHPSLLLFAVDLAAVLILILAFANLATLLPCVMSFPAMLSTPLAPMFAAQVAHAQRQTFALVRMVTLVVNAS